jgi:DNA (cytosine-5)-methyltransferase 1
MGYHRAFPDAEIVGVDINPQPNYPFTFVQGDATTYPTDGFDFIHASPPCQHFTRYRNVVKDIADRYLDHLPATIERLAASGVPHTIENVEGAPLRADVTLCGSMFGLKVRRHRVFQCSFPIMSPPCNHGVWTDRPFKGSTGRGPRFTIEVGAWNEPLWLQKECMGVDWQISLRELSEAIPPAYTEYIALQFQRTMEVSV